MVGWWKEKSDKTMKRVYLVRAQGIILNTSYVLQMFAMVVLFGLYHGVIFLPVILCLLGPTNQEEVEEEDPEEGCSPSRLQPIMDKNKAASKSPLASSNHSASLENLMAATNGDQPIRSLVSSAKPLGVVSNGTAAVVNCDNSNFSVTAGTDNKPC